MFSQTKDLGIKQVTLLGFRDHVLLRLHSEGKDFETDLCCALGNCRWFVIISSGIHYEYSIHWWVHFLSWISEQFKLHPDVLPSIHQMLLVLQVSKTFFSLGCKTSFKCLNRSIIFRVFPFKSVRESDVPTQNRKELQKLVVMVISPYLGDDGLYEGGPEPVVKANKNNVVQYRKKPESSRKFFLLW